MIIDIGDFDKMNRKTKKRRIEDKRTWGYCFLYAIKQYYKHGGYIMIRRSKKTFLPFPHFLWCPNEKCRRMKQFIPVKERRHYKWLPPFYLFKGKEKSGDD